MLRQVPSRNQRTKGLRVKHVLQISLLLAISVWLLYQIMHSHDKKSTYVERNSKSSLKLDESQTKIFKFGRKDLPRTVETDSVTESRIKEKENKEVGDVEQENKHEETEDGGGGGGNDEIDEQDQEKVEEEANHGKEIDDEEDKNEDKNGQVEELDLLKDREHEEVSHEARVNSFKGDDASNTVVHYTQVKEQEERSREAQEMSFKGDDASSAVGHDAQVTEHEVGSYEKREKSFQDDDASSAVEHDIQVTESKSENGGSGGVDEKQLGKMERKEIENETTNGTIGGFKGNDSSAAGSDISNTRVSIVIHEDSETTPNNYLTRNGNAVEKRESDVGAYRKLEDGSSSNSTTGKSNNHTEQQADLPTVNAIGNQTEPHMNSKKNEMELQTTSSTMFSHKREPQMNSTSVSDQSESEIKMMVIDTVTSGVPQQNESAALESVQDQHATVEMVTPSDNKSNLENIVMEQTESSNTTARPEESGGSSTTSSAKNENGETVSTESGNSSH
ncbi:myb-like protein X [Phoenix dactylifera]|uniref:Myb-like protein X n=1 Tax=Phoenix dactylifera TaxID=42345 RepID=A0A8B7C2Q7_PHODC|nr:myb-like protein X [Phoenix dactylifera]